MGVTEGHDDPVKSTIKILEKEGKTVIENVETNALVARGRKLNLIRKY